MKPLLKNTKGSYNKEEKQEEDNINYSFLEYYKIFINFNLD